MRVAPETARPFCFAPAEQTAAAQVARLEKEAPEPFAGIDPRVRARAELINKLRHSGTAPEKAPQRAEATGLHRTKKSPAASLGRFGDGGRRCLLAGVIG